MSTFGQYQPGSSPLHRLPAGVKLVALAVSIALMAVWVQTPADLAVAALGVAALVAAAGLRPRALTAQLRPVLWVVAVIFGFQLLFTDWRRALVVCGILLLSVVLAAVVTVTTRVTAMLAALTALMRPLGRVGFPVDQLALALALTLRTIPLMIDTVRQVEEARRARGLRFSPRIVLAPVITAALDTADGFAEALTARGLD
ncbi:cobalt transport protein [Mycolicibacterium phlei]|jgi:biotin transport system permease protein|uniref:Cobalt transport protein n=3 Tax=Mycolicibacterium TaxID=1866885 RepID=G7CM98_MYCT3|nr:MULTISPECIES: CbiQ family ECF transporter T component [Mycolicibacterium]VEG08793.1 cobalt transport protein [Mycobacteroides chelonae]AMO60675.1 Energy-coupling factor transporter transmembrane protein BioN [Mycolicibacterium phlei]EHI11051.1 cobalt transport protein [Mycolicibacterium thermoresistibile ATCC 19527]EID09804.1 cobalt transport protein [Mycolicibacterium phlei RIVM601174]KAB7751449.1 cobalt ABC transporter [Mycolicibacterium phlei DSM 43239 = CCUG 21000]